MEHLSTKTFINDLCSTTPTLRLSRSSYTAATASSLITKSSLSHLHLGTGASLYLNITPLLLSTTTELILVTCFWASSPTLATLNNVLLCLSSKSLTRDPTGETKIRVRICLSSLSLWQKLFQAQEAYGCIYPPEQWETKLGLPRPDELRGLDLEVRCKFFRPLSVMHPKFVMVDGETVVLPSCNVSWEDWFEGGVVLDGAVVGHFKGFWERHWGGYQGSKGAGAQFMPSGDIDDNLYTGLETDQSNQGDVLPRRIALDIKDVDTVFLESDYHVNPYFMPFPWQRTPPPPWTPLNAFLLSVFRTVERRIYIQTPNVTAIPVLNAILDMLGRGVEVHIVTSERLMILEQLVTAGTTTARCMQRLINRYRDMKARAGLQSPTQERLMEEGGVVLPGRLVVEYYQPARSQTRGQTCVEPVQSHLKLTVADDELVILGSGNMDRASWYTSQELGVAFYSPALAETLQTTLEALLRPRKKLLFDSRNNT